MITWHRSVAFEVEAIFILFTAWSYIIHAHVSNPMLSYEQNDTGANGVKLQVHIVKIHLKVKCLYYKPSGASA